MTRRGQRSRGDRRRLQEPPIVPGNTAVEEVPREMPVPQLFQQGSSGPPRVFGVVSITSPNDGSSASDSRILQSWTEAELQEEGWQASEMRFDSNSIMAVERAFEQTDNRINLEQAQSSHVGSGDSSRSIDDAATWEAKAYLNHFYWACRVLGRREPEGSALKCQQRKAK